MAVEAVTVVAQILGGREQAAEVLAPEVQQPRGKDLMEAPELRMDPHIGLVAAVAVLVRKVVHQVQRVAVMVAQDLKLLG